MTRFLQRSLTNAELTKLPDMRYEGRIARVVPQQVFNRWKYTKDEIVPVISFEDGYEWIPNIGGRRLLTEVWGPDTDQWIGKYIRVVLKTNVRTEAKSGRAIEKLEKHVEPLD